MKALMKTEKDVGLEVGDFPDPEVGDREALIDVAACGICGTDMAIYDWKNWASDLVGDKIPVVLGHEFGGEVLEVGSAVKNFSVGDRVVAEPFISCLSCYYCRNGSTNLCENRTYFGVNRHGGAAEFASVDESCLYKIPDSIPSDHIPLLETVATCVRPMERVRIQPGDVAVVIGPGAIGLCLMQAARAAGARSVGVLSTPHSEGRLEVAEELGADFTLLTDDDPAAEVQARTDGRGADVVFDSTGSQPAAEDAFSMVRRGGSICIVGVSDDPIEVNPYSQLMMREVDLISSLARTGSAWYRTLSLVESGDIELEPLLGDRVPLENALDAFDILADREAVKVLLKP